MPALPFFPRAASTLAPRVDALFFFVLAVTLFFTALIAVVGISFAVKYRRRRLDDRGADIAGSNVLEIAWTAIPLGIVLFIFVWGAKLYFAEQIAPQDALVVHVVGKQWMWMFQHPEGQRELDTLHVPTGRPVKLVLASQDVIHSFFVPAFRLKQDAVPGRYTSLWFQATDPGEFQIFCAEYCGTSHSMMIGRVIAMEPSRYQNWLSTGGAAGSLADLGRKRFENLGCQSCHLSQTQGRGPRLEGVFGSNVLLRDGSTVVADENYVRESILDPQARVVAGFEPIMPTFKGLITEQDLFALIEYVKMLGPAPGANPTPAPNPPAQRAAGRVPPANPGRPR